MDRDAADRMSCVVCGLETRRHTGWFLVVENCWLDRLKILAWHPVLAQQARMRSVCSEEHLRTLLTHWLTHANLQFLATGSSSGARDGSSDRAESDYLALCGGKVVGELAVHREALSRVWTGSPEALECILKAMMDRVERRPASPAFQWVDRGSRASMEAVLN